MKNYFKNTHKKDEISDDLQFEKIASDVKISFDEKRLEQSRNIIWSRIASRIYDEQNVSKNLSFYRNIVRWSAAASIIIAVTLIFNINIGDKDIVYVTSANKTNDNMQVMLPDGSNVWLSPNSTIAYPQTFEDKTRQVKLEGEAFFDIVKTEDKRFVVATSVVDITVLGTRFNVNTNHLVEDAVDVVLESGKVALNSSGDNSDNYLAVLEPGEKAHISRKQDITISKVDVYMYTCWKDNYLVLQSQTFENMILMLSKKYNANIIIKSEVLCQERFSGRFNHMDNITEVFDIIDKSLPIKYEYINNVWYISSK